MKTRLFAMGAAVCLAAALAACGGGGGGGTPVTPTPTFTPTIAPTQTPSGTNVTLSGSQQTATMPPVAGFSGTITVPTGSGTINVTDSTTNPSGVTLQSAGAPRAEATATPTPNPYGCVGSTTYSKTGTHSMVAAPPHPIAGGDTFAYSGTLASTYAQTAPCPEPTATSNATVTVNVAATPTALPGVTGTVSDLKSTESDAFATQTTTTVTDQYVQNLSNSYVLYEQKSSDTAGNSLDRKYTAPQILDTLAGSGTWTNPNPAGTQSETLADGTSVSRTIAADGSYTETENFPNLQTTSRNGILYFTVTAESNVTLNGIPGFTLTVPSGVTGSVSLAILSGGQWTTVEGPVTISGNTATFPVSAGTLTLTAGQKVYLAIFQTVTSTASSGTATISVKGQATGSSIDGSGIYSIAGTTFAYAAPSGAVGSGTITLTIGGSTTRTFPAWFNVPASYITDTFVDNGQVNFDPNCSVNGTISTQAGGKGNQIVETNSTLDPVLGYQETRVTTSYVVNGYGAVCVKIDDTLNSFYDYQNDTTKIDYQSQNGSPNSVNHIVEYLGMSSPAVAYTSVRTQSVSQQAVSPLLVAQHVAAIQLQRDTQRAAKIRALLKGNAR